MSKYESKSLRNVAIIGHGGTGKTTLCESLLYVAGKSDRPGRVDDGTSSMDYAVSYTHLTLPTNREV